MANHQPFSDLLTRYLQGDIGPEEYLELIRLIRTGAYDDYLRQQIDQQLGQAMDGQGAELDAGRAQVLLDRILRSEKQTVQLIKGTAPLFRRMKWAVAAAVMVLLVGSVLYWLPGRKVASLREPVVTPRTGQPGADSGQGSGGRKFIRMDDGSTVLLNKGSRVVCEAGFGEKTREVTLVGEAYFEIKHEEGRPFIVHTGRVSTTVLGTAFNIRAYPSDKNVIVTVTRGKVRVSDRQTSLGVATPNESIAVNMESNTSRRETVNADEVIDWKKDCLVFDNISLREASALIRSRYHVDISFSNPAVGDCRITATFLNNESLEQVLTVVSGVVNASFTLQPNDQVIISGSGCN